ncbi:hypothetical protein NPIL_128661 [Nephila pilipes]|uniref:Uncharacterized protein n=1 Tax=Nephila pilipes TaxID=299642 RepID=A0A8X6TZ29_NEPPI|nr:hypothetical protein NPIL_128661 [Nephila pilipes]
MLGRRHLFQRERYLFKACLAYSINEPFYRSTIHQTDPIPNRFTAVLINRFKFKPTEFRNSCQQQMDARQKRAHDELSNVIIGHST